MRKQQGSWQKDLEEISDLVRAFHKIRIENSIKGSPLYTLADILPQKTALDLREMAKLSMIQGTSRMKKDRLVAELLSKLPDVDHVATKLSLLSPLQWSFFCKVLETESHTDNRVFVDSYLMTQEFGLIQSFYDDEDMSFVVPNEMKQICCTLAEDGSFDDIGKSVSFRAYGRAAVSLYGIIPLNELVELYNSQNDDKTDEDELFQNLLLFIGETDSDFYFWEEYLVHPSFEEEDFEAVAELAAECEGKPRYIPEKEEFLRYAEGLYFEKTEQTKQLEQYLRTSFGMATYDARDMVEVFAMMAAVETPLQEQIEVLEEAYGSFKSETQAKRYFELMMELHNHSRMWRNKGHTPQELSAYHSGPVLSVARGGKKKTGRNEPCPCGSGKKYKHCCGKGS